MTNLMTVPRSHTARRLIRPALSGEIDSTGWNTGVPEKDGSLGVGAAVGGTGVADAHGVGVGDGCGDGDGWGAVVGARVTVEAESFATDGTAIGVGADTHPTKTSATAGNRTSAPLLPTGTAPDRYPTIEYSYLPLTGRPCAKRLY